MLVQNSLDEVDPKLLEAFSKLGIPISEQKRLAGVKNVAYDYVFDSESIATTFKKELAQQGIIFCSISEAVREYPDLIKKHLGSVVGHSRIFSVKLPSDVHQPRRLHRQNAAHVLLHSCMKKHLGRVACYSRCQQLPCNALHLWRLHQQSARCMPFAHLLSVQELRNV